MKYFPSLNTCARPAILLLALASCTGIRAQVYNTGNLFVAGGTTVFNTGNFTNTSTGNYLNNGVVYIAGNISNDQAAMAPGSGDTYFNGLSAQTLSGSAAFRAFNLHLNNAAGLTLTDRLGIGDGTAGSLSFLSGEINSGTSSQDVYFYPGSSYTGFDATHHIVGYVTKSGPSDFDFPIGDGSHTADLTLSSLSGAADFQVLYTGAGYGQYTTNASLANQGVSYFEWWNIGQTAGSVSAQVTLNWNDARKTLNHSAPSGLVVANFSGGIWQSAGGTSTSPAGGATGVVGPSNTVSSFGPFTFGSTLNSLPILLTSFTVKNQGCQAYLSWTTSLEENASGFDVQSSNDGTNFTTAAFVKADDTPSTYHLLVKQTARQAFYRIRLVDVDGQFKYSGIGALSLPCIPYSDQLSIYPNPVWAGGSTTVQLNSPVARGMAQLALYDGAGNKVYAEMVNVAGGVNSYVVATGRLAQGIYTVQVTGAGWQSNALQLSCCGH